MKYKKISDGEEVVLMGDSIMTYKIGHMTYKIGLTKSRNYHSLTRLSRRTKMIDIRHEYYRIKEKLQMRIAWGLPKWLVMWATIRLLAHATTGEYGNTETPALLVIDALKRWETA